MCNARQTNLANTLHVGGSSRAQRPNTPPGQHVCKRVFAHACIFCAAHLPGGAEISARVTRQKVLFFVRKDASEKALLKKKRKERVLKAQMNISRRVLSSPDDYGTRGAFSWEGEKKRRWLESVVNVLTCATDRFSSYHHTNEKLITILDVSKKLRN